MIAAGKKAQCEPFCPTAWLPRMVLPLISNSLSLTVSRNNQFERISFGQR